MEPFFYNRNPYNYYFPNRARYVPNRAYGYNNYVNNNRTNSNVHEEKHSNDNNRNKEPKPEARNIKTDKPIFEIFGIKLFFDDILLVSLIFFLYNEGVKDESLFIALILLLLS